jgi:hypothetical protein
MKGGRGTLTVPAILEERHHATGILLVSLITGQRWGTYVLDDMAMVTDEEKGAAVWEV